MKLFFIFAFIVSLVDYLNSSPNNYVLISENDNSEIQQGQKSEITISTTGTYNITVDTRTDIEKLTDTNPIVRRISIIKLGEEKNRNNLFYLKKFINDPDPEIRKVVINALYQCSTTDNDKNELILLFLKHFESEKDLGVQISYINIFSKFKSRQIVNKLLSLLKHDYPLIRANAVRSLGIINNETTYNSIIGMLNDETEGVKIEAIRVITNLKIKSAIKELIKNLDSKVNIVRKETIYALGELGSVEIIPELEKLLNDNDKSIAESSKIAIEKIKGRTKRTAVPKK